MRPLAIRLLYYPLRQGIQVHNLYAPRELLSPKCWVLSGVTLAESSDNNSEEFFSPGPTKAWGRAPPQTASEIIAGNVISVVFKAPQEQGSLCF